MISIDGFQGPVLVTVAYLFLWYYFLLGLQRGTKYRLIDEFSKRGEVFDRYFGANEEMLAVDRVVINTHEQMIPFLTCMWLCAVFVSTTLATACGVIYVLSRAAYPLLIGKRVSKIQPKRVFLSTLPGYLMILVMMLNLVYASLS